MKPRYKEVGHNKTLPQQGHPAGPSSPISTFVSPRYNEKPELPDTTRQPPWPQGPSYKEAPLYKPHKVDIQINCVSVYK